MLTPSEVQIIPSAQLLAGLSQLIAAGGPFNTLTLLLFKNNFTLGRSTLIGDLVEADYTGYAAVAGLTFAGPYYDVDGTALLLAADEVLVATAPTPPDPFVPNTVYGYALTNAAKDSLRAAYKFAASVPIARPGDAVVVAPFLRYSGT